MDLRYRTVSPQFFRFNRVEILFLSRLFLVRIACLLLGFEDVDDEF